MTKSTLLRLLALLALCCTVLGLVSCADTEVGENTELARCFMDHVIAADYDSAYGMVDATVTDADFRAYWDQIRLAAQGAGSYELEQIGWNVNSHNGVTDRTTAYQVYLDNGRTVLLRVLTRDGIEDIAGIHFSDITDFLASTETYVPTVQIILWVVSGLCIAFTVWMLVDCIRRKLKYKALLILMILMGLTLSITVGETSNLSFTVGLFCIPSSIVADPGLVSVVVQLILPVGAILYLCLRGKFTPAEPLPDVDTLEPPSEDPDDTSADQ